jgi:hypothetical protein
MLPALPALATEQAGVSAAVTGQVALSRPQVVTARPVVSGEPILLQDTIRSGVRSGAQVLLLDQTVFTIGPESELVVDEFVYDPGTNAGKMSAKLAQGVFRFVSGTMAKKHPEDVTLALPSGTLGVRGTLVGGRVDGATKSSLLVLLGEGRDNDTGAPAGEIEVCNAGSCVQVRSAGFGTRIGGPDAPPLEPFRVPAAELDALTQAVSDPLDWAGEAKQSGGDTPDVAADSNSGDTRSPTEISGRGAAAGEPSGANSLDWLRGVANLDAATAFASQDEQTALDSPPDNFDSGGDSLGGLPPTEMMRLATYGDLASLPVVGGSQTAVYAKSGIALTDGGAYDFSLTLDVGRQLLNVATTNVSAPSLGISGESLLRTQSFDSGGSGLPVFVRDSGRFTGHEEGPCGSGCDAFIQAYLFSDHGRVADSVLQSLAIVPDQPETGPASAPVYTAHPYESIAR